MSRRQPVVSGAALDEDATTGPRVHYAQAEGASVAYQTFGGGERSIVLIPPFAHNIELIWERPEAVRFFRRLGSMGRVVHYDKRGCGRSDRRLPPASLENRTSDLRAVLDVEGIERAVIVGASEGGTLAMFFAATYPERVEALILKGGYATFVKTADHPFALTERRRRLAASFGRPLWGRGVFYSRYMARSMRTVRGFRKWAGRFERESLDASRMPTWAVMNSALDVRAILAAIHVPTLAAHSSKDPLIPIEASHYIAEKIPGARFVELPGADHVPWFGAQDDFLDSAEDFLDGERATPERGRFLATVLFTDIVRSTALAAELGDSKWVELLDRHDAITRELTSESGGRWIKSTGDGALSTFENPSEAVRCAVRLSTRVSAECGFDIRAGLHTAEIELREGDIGGLAVHEAARVQAKAGPGEVLVSKSTRALVNGGEIDFDVHSTEMLRGLPGPTELFRVAA